MRGRRLEHLQCSPRILSLQCAMRECGVNNELPKNVYLCQSLTFHNLHHDFNIFFPAHHINFRDKPCESVCVYDQVEERTTTIVGVCIFPPPFCIADASASTQRRCMCVRASMEKIFLLSGWLRMRVMSQAMILEPSKTSSVS